MAPNLDQLLSSNYFFTFDSQFNLPRSKLTIIQVMKTNSKYGPVYLNSLRETFLILLTWIVFAIWVVGYSLRYGYNLHSDTFSTVIGIPEWVFWGIGLPWILAIFITIGFAVFVVKDDPLEESDEAPTDEQEFADSDEQG